MRHKTVKKQNAKDVIFTYTVHNTVNRKRSVYVIRQKSCLTFFLVLSIIKDENVAPPLSKDFET
jgi:hypothetical protein